MKEPPIDAHVTCPRCHERQAIPDLDGYTCVSCGTPWVFATCRSCHERFHMDPATSDWDCPNCGAHNGPAAPSNPVTSVGTSMPLMDGHGAMVAIVAGVVVLLIAIWVIFIRDPGASTNAVSPSVAVTSTAPVGTVAHLCSDVAADIPLRVDSVNRAEDAVRADARALQREGNTEAAKAAITLADALAEFAAVLDTQGDTLVANTAVQEALAALPC